MFVAYPHTKFHTPNCNDPLVIDMKLKGKCSMHRPFVLTLINKKPYNKSAYFSEIWVEWLIIATGIRKTAGVRQDISLLHGVDTASGAHPAFYPMRTGYKAAGEWRIVELNLKHPPPRLHDVTLNSAHMDNFTFHIKWHWCRTHLTSSCVRHFVITDCWKPKNDIFEAAPTCMISRISQEEHKTIKNYYHKCTWEMSTCCVRCIKHMKVCRFSF
jgi:hypothetical protein